MRDFQIRTLWLCKKYCLFACLQVRTLFRRLASPTYPSSLVSKTSKTSLIFSLAFIRLAIMLRNSSSSIDPLLSWNVYFSESPSFSVYTLKFWKSLPPDCHWTRPGGLVVSRPFPMKFYQWKKIHPSSKIDSTCKPLMHFKNPLRFWNFLSLCK